MITIVQFSNEYIKHQDLIAWQIAEIEDVKEKAQEEFELLDNEVKKEMYDKFPDDQLRESQISFWFSNRMLESEAFTEKIESFFDKVASDNIPETDINKMFSENVPYGAVITRFISLASKK